MSLPGNSEMKQVYIEPCGHRVLILPDPIEKTSKGGIVIATDVQEGLERRQTQTGTVVAVGEQAFKAFCSEQRADGTTKWGEPWVKVGDRVAHVRWAGRVVKDPVTEVEYTVMNDSDITAKFKPNPVAEIE